MTYKDPLSADPRIEKPELHPLGLELLVNCAACGNLLNAQLCSSFSDAKAFSKQILITVERCVCDTAADF